MRTALASRGARTLAIADSTLGTTATLFAADNDKLRDAGTIVSRRPSPRGRDCTGASCNKKNAPEVVARQMPCGEFGIVYDPGYPTYTASSCGRPLICF